MPRNGSGTFTLVSGNPVVTGTTIESNWANTTLSDIATTLTDSLSRSGQGGMTAALRIADGTQGAPGVGFANETGSGFYRAGTGEVWAVVQGAQTLNLDANGVYVPADKTTTVDGAFVFNEAGADKDARFEGDTDANLLFTDASTDRVGIGTNTPASKLDVVGDVTVSGTVNATTLDLTNIEVTNIKAKDGTASMTLADSTGVASFSANPVFSGGTANGVVYLNGSKVATSGSALTFSGTSLSVTGNFFSSNAGSENYYLSDGTTRTSLQQNGNALYYNVNDNSATNGQFIWRSTNALSELMRLTSTGLGIGTSSPAYKLDVEGSQRIRKTGAGYNAEMLSFSTISETGAIYRMGMATGAAFVIGRSDVPRTDLTLDSSGNLGLGVTPGGNYTLQTQTNFNSGFKGFNLGSLRGGASGGGYPWTGYNIRPTGTSNTYNYDAGDVASAIRFADGINFYTAPSGTAGNAISFTQAMTLDASGNLGVGPTSPSAKLHVGTQSGGVAAPTQLRLDTSYASTATPTNQQLKLALAYISATEAYGFALDNLSGIWYHSGNTTGPTGNHIFATGGTERARITSGGDLLVGCTATPSATVSGVMLRNPISGGTSIFSSGTTNSATLVSFFNNNGSVGRIDVASSATSYVTSSDRRLKENIVSAPSASNVIDAIQIVSHDWKAAPDEHVTYGVIAQDLHAVAPQAVSVGDDGDEVEKAWGVDYSKLVPMLIKEIQSLRARVAALEAQP